MALRIDDHFDMADWVEMDRFISQTHGQRHPMRDRDLFEWFYCRNANDPAAANLVVAHDQSAVVAILGYIPTAFLYDGNRVQGAWGALWYALPEYRHGVGVLLMRRYTELFDIVAGQGASEMNRAIVKVMGHHFEDPIPKVVMVLDEPAMRAWLPQYQIRSIEPSSSAESGPPVRHLDASGYSPDWSRYPELSFSTLRDFDYLNHRYVENPFLSYEVLVLGDPETCSVAVVRVIVTNAGVTVGRVVEFFGPDVAAFADQSRALLRHVVSWCRSQGCSYIDFYCTSHDTIAIFEENGFARDDTGELPSLLDPVDFSRRSQNVEYHIKPHIRAQSEWRGTMYASRGDGDQDRPNASYSDLKRIGS